MDGHNFTRRSVERVGDTVRRMENTPRSLAGQPTTPPPLVPFQFRRFELKEALQSFNFAPAYLLEWSELGGGGLIRKTFVPQGGSSEQVEFIVRDELGWSGDAGAKGYCVKMHDIPEARGWEVIAMECP